MKLRYTLIAIFALLFTSFGAVTAHDDHDHGTPDAGHETEHSDHDHDHHDHGDMHGHDGNMSMGAFYLTLTNNGDESDRLVMIETDMADIVEIHDVEMDDGVMQMVPMHDGVEIAPGEEIVFEPGSYHVMLIGISESLLDGEEFTAVLHFESAGEVEITVPIHALEPEDGDFAEPVEVGDGDIEVSNIWARQAPKLDGMATPMATPDATPGH